MAARRKRSQAPSVSFHQGENGAFGLTIHLPKGREWATRASASRAARKKFGDSHFWRWRDAFAGLAAGHVVAAAHSQLLAACQVSKLIVEISHLISEAREVMDGIAVSPDLAVGLKLWRDTEEWQGPIVSAIGPDLFRWVEDEWHPVEFGRLRLRLDELGHARDKAREVALGVAQLAHRSLHQRAPRGAAAPATPMGPTSVARAVIRHAPGISRDPSTWALMSIGVGLESPCKDTDEFWKKRFVHWKTALTRASRR